jgi:hypothetical protein
MSEGETKQFKQDAMDTLMNVPAEERAAPQAAASVPVAETAPIPSAGSGAATAMKENSVIKSMPPAPQPQPAPVVNNISNSPTTTLMSAPSARDGGANQMTVFNGMVAFG